MKKLFSLILLSFFCLQMKAVPAKPVIKTIRTTDGRTVSVTLKGDEHFSFYQTDDGEHFHKLESGLLKPYSEFEFLNVAVNATKSREASNVRRAARRKDASGITGKHTGLIILANFTDVKFTTGTNEIYQDFFNKSGYSDYSNAGSVHDYFYDQSYGNFDVDFDVVGPIALPNDMAYYGEPIYDADGNITSNDKRAQQFAADAVKTAAETESLDFTKYDWDNDGTVDQVFIIFAGYAQSSGADVNTIWPHEYNIGAYGLVYNNKKINVYGCASELSGSTGSTLCGIGTACHEFSHCLGLPDTYDVGYSGNFGMGDWDIMATGCYLGDSHAPTGYTAYERWMSGWLEPTAIDEETTVTDMKRLEDSPEAYILFNEGNTDEYYMLENRNNAKWGKELSAHGLLVTHIDYDASSWYYNSINSTTDHERMTVIPADNMRKTNYEGDPYPGTRKNYSLTDESTPAASVFNKNVDDSYFMGKPIEEITESSDGFISFKAMTGVVFGPKNLSAKAVSDTSFKLSWDEIENADSYEVDITSIDAPKTNPYDAVMFEEDFATTCYNKTVSTLNNVATKLDNYTKTQGWTGTYLYRGPNGLQIGTAAKVGTLKTPETESPFYGKTTARLTIGPSASGESVTTAINVYIGGSYYGKYSITVSSKNTYVLSGMPENHSTFAYEIAPDKRLDVSYFAVFDGDFSEEDFENNSSSKAKIISLNRITHSSDSPDSADGDVITSNTNSIVYDNVSSGKTYLCKVRAKLNNGNYSKWSAQLSYTPSTTGITEMKSDSPEKFNGKSYSISGQQVNDNYKGIKIQNGRKILCK